MGILNRTPDSFYDRGATWDVRRVPAPGRAARRRRRRPARRRRREGRARARGRRGRGARPGRSRDRGAARALRRAAVGRHVARRRCSTPRARAGAVVGNDISGFADPDYLDVAAKHDATVVATTSGCAPASPTPTRTTTTSSADVTAFLLDRAHRAEAAGLAPEQIVLDAGLDLGKTPAQSAVLLRGDRAARGARLPAAAVGVEQAVHRRAARARDRRPARRVARGGRLRRRSQGCRIVRVHDVRGTARTCAARSRRLLVRHVTYLVQGADPSLRDREVQRVVDELLGGDDRSFALDDHTIGEPAPGGRRRRCRRRRRRVRRSVELPAFAAITNALQSPPFMTASRVVVVREIGNLVAEQAQVARGVDRRPARRRAPRARRGRGPHARRARQGDQGARARSSGRRRSDGRRAADTSCRRRAPEARAAPRPSRSPRTSARTPAAFPSSSSCWHSTVRRRRRARPRRRRAVSRRARHRGPLRAHERDRPRRRRRRARDCCTAC